jgi:uncharacterized membrane protein YbhN (UPF0104 family)
VRVGQLALTVVVTWFILRTVGLGLDQLGEVAPSTWLPSPIPLAAATLLLLVAYLLSGALWGRIVADLGGPPLPTGEAARLFMIANVGRYVPGKIWQIAGLAALARSRRVPPATATGAAVLGHGIALLAASAVGVAALVTAPDPYRRWGVLAGTVVATFVALCAVPAVFTRLATAWFALTRTEPPAALGRAHAVRWLLLYALNWLLYAVSFWVLCLSLGLAGPVVSVSSSFAAAYVLGYLMIFAPAGLGPREGFLIAFLTPHFGAAASGVVAVVARLWTTLVELALAALFWASWVSGRGREEPGASGSDPDPTAS